MMRLFARGGAEAASLGASDLLWIDLNDPSEAEEKDVEATLGIDVPTPAERAAFEDSARFYEEGGALFLTATFLGRREDGPFHSGAVTFILTNGKLVTVRQINPRAFDIGERRASARIGSAQTGGDVAMALLEGAAERLADVLAEATRDAQQLSQLVFAEEGPAPDLRASLRTLGRIGALTSMSHDSLSSLQRLGAFADHVCDKHELPHDRLQILRRDIEELERLAEALQSRLAFLQDASLGLINAGQSDVLKALSVATMVFVPPTLIASIFGMNFEAMHWFKTGWGPWAAFAMMAIAPAALFALAKWRRWF
jgi:magnesium transporter